MNRIITPVYLRNKDASNYLCPACHPESQVSSIVSTEVTPKDLVKENGMEWLGIKPNDGLFKGRSAFKLMAKHGMTVFDPVEPTNKSLVLRSKPVQNPFDALKQVERWVETGMVELGCCALCFGDSPKHNLLPACGRRGCRQRAHNECLRSWVCCGYKLTKI
jgi:hypothetical protein